MAEESYAIELHLNSCPFCNEAIEGLFEQQEGSAAEAVVELNANFLKDHFSLHNPQVHLNSMAPAQPIAQVQPRQRKRLRSMPFWRPSGIAAMLLLALVIIWYYRSGESIRNRQIAQTTDPAPAGEVQNAHLQSTGQPLASADLIEVDEEPIVVQSGIGNSPQSPQQPQQPVIIADNSVEDVKQAKEIERKDKAAKDQAKKEEKEPVVAQYRTPLVDKPAAPQAPAADEIEKMPSRTTNSVAATSAGTNPKPASEKTVSLKETRTSEASADDLYSDKKYSAALKLYKEQMNSGSRSKRNYAAIQSARCYLALGNKQSAIKLLQGIVNEGGAHKRAARRMLEDLGVDKAE